MLMIITSRSFDHKLMKLCQNVNHFRRSFELGHVGLKTMLLGQILEKPCVHSRGHSFDPKFMQLFVRILIIIISKSDLKLVHVGLKTRSLGQILEKPCVHSRRHSFDPSFMKLCYNI